MWPPRALFLIFLTGQAKFRSITSYPRSARMRAAADIVSGSLPMIWPATGWSSSLTSILLRSPSPPLTRITSNNASVTAYGHPRRRGCPYAVTEALLDVILVNGGEGLRKSIDVNDEDHPVAGQIIGSDPETMSAAARILADRGYDVIDLNFACPVKKIKN